MSSPAQNVGQWTPIETYAEPDWDHAGDVAPMLFWRPRKGASFGFIRDGELFDAKWVYISDANKVTLFAKLNPPD